VDAATNAHDVLPTVGAEQIGLDYGTPGVVARRLRITPLILCGSGISGSVPRLMGDPPARRGRSLTVVEKMPTRDRIWRTRFEHVRTNRPAPLKSTAATVTAARPAGHETWNG
jgi:hypothetical protein